MPLLVSMKGKRNYCNSNQMKSCVRSRVITRTHHFHQMLQFIALRINEQQKSNEQETNQQKTNEQKCYEHKNR